MIEKVDIVLFIIGMGLIGNLKLFFFLNGEFVCWMVNLFGELFIFCVLFFIVFW